MVWHGSAVLQAGLSANTIDRARANGAWKNAHFAQRAGGLQCCLDRGDQTHHVEAARLQPHWRKSKMNSAERIDLTDDEVDAICAGLVQNAAKLRYLRDVLKLRVDRRPNGRPLVRRTDWIAMHHEAQNASLAHGPKWSRTL